MGGRAGAAWPVAGPKPLLPGIMRRRPLLRPLRPMCRRTPCCCCPCCHYRPLQAFLTKLLTVDLPALMTLPRRLEINIPPAVTAGAN